MTNKNTNKPAKTTEPTKVQQAVEAIKKIGLEHFLLATKTIPNAVTLHFQDMPINQAMEIIIAGFHQVIQMDVERNPQYSKEVKAIYDQLQKNFNLTIRQFNESIQKQNNRSQPQK